jgi:uncharacterized membrane protein YoaK (UPF0700 family)
LPVTWAGNFVTFGAAVALGTSGAIAKLLALPVFCMIVLLARLLSYQLKAHNLPVLRTMLFLKLALLIAAAILAVTLGPFPKGDGWPAIVTGMTLVAAMALQNAAHRVHLTSAPPSTLMTGTTTQVMLDIADLIHGVKDESGAITRSRLTKMISSVACFAIGCGIAAAVFITAGIWCLALPPILGVIALLAHTATPEGDVVT